MIGSGARDERDLDGCYRDGQAVSSCSSSPSEVDLLHLRVPGNDLGMSDFALQDDLEKLSGGPL